ncbi:MAG: hypothetical protein H6Q43_1343, partial [Deltaproteobacteria bacterium]|nr:hypothetical protein [Deltaproteobacteria bacterium]
MKKPWVVLIAVLCLIVPLSYATGAELAKQGEGTIRMAHTGTYKLL